MVVLKYNSYLMMVNFANSAVTLPKKGMGKVLRCIEIISESVANMMVAFPKPASTRSVTIEILISEDNDSDPAVKKSGALINIFPYSTGSIIHEP